MNEPNDFTLDDDIDTELHEKLDALSGEPRDNDVDVESIEAEEFADIDEGDEV